MSEVLLFDGRYRVLHPIGSGGMAQVYLAEQTSLNRKVAIKILKRDLRTDPTMAARFKREALLASTVDHPSVVKVLEFEVEGDHAAVVLEYVEGARLDTLVSATGISISRAVQLLTQLAEGLAAIHTAGIVHRDFKPENIIVTGSGFEERARVFDFGIARLHGVETVGGNDAQFISSIGQGVGSPSYVAPEQARGEVVGPQADVYAFGVTAFQVVTGKLPFTAEKTQDLLAAHLDKAPPKLGDLQPHVTAVPGLAEVVAKCLEKEPSKRFANGGELAAAMAKLQVDTSKLSQVSEAVVPKVARAPRPRGFGPMLVGSMLVATAPAWALLEPWSVETRAEAMLRFAPMRSLELVNDATSSRGVQTKVKALRALGRDDEAAAVESAMPHRARASNR